MSPDAIEDPEAGALFYRVRSETDAITLPGAWPYRVLPGTSGSVDIELRRRRIAELLLEPALQVAERPFTK